MLFKESIEVYIFFLNIFKKLELVEFVQYYSWSKK